MADLTTENSVPVLDMCYYGHPALRRQCKDIDEITDDVRYLAESMVATMYAHDGIGLAAPQIGESINLVVMDVPCRNSAESGQSVSPGEIVLAQQMPIVLVNPRLSEFSEQVSSYDEGCLSIPGLTGEVVRPEFMTIEYTTLDGETTSLRCGGLLVRCMAHEVDHLNGILFIDHMTDEALKPLKGKLKKMEKETLRELRK
jgi:peptide deformylase